MKQYLESFGPNRKEEILLELKNLEARNKRSNDQCRKISENSLEKNRAEYEPRIRAVSGFISRGKTSERDMRGNKRKFCSFQWLRQ